MLMVGSVTFSELLGFTSIGCWLGAQFPQVIENIRRQSCEGLALPFLANWLLGDISNLVGCLLTDQLPFQTWLATYFVAVDLVLVVQYFYYYKPPKAHPSIHSHLRSATLPGSGRRMSVDRGASRYRTLSAVASNVAAAAALAAQQDEGEFPHTPRYLRRAGRQSRQTTSTSLTRESEHIEDQEPPPGMMESFHSEGGRDTVPKRVSWSIERHGGRAASVGRGMRPMHLNLNVPVGPNSAVGSETVYHEEPSSGLEASVDSLTPTIVSARSARADRRGSSMVFLGVWALFSFGALSTSHRGGFSSGVTNVGRVLWSPHIAEQPMPLTVDSIIPRKISTPDLEHFEANFEDSPLPVHLKDEPHHDEPLPDEPSSQQILGRFFAWLCCILYLTSRLPQIWKNGLSMYLFIFAFLGNVFYVSSILTSPNVSLPPSEAWEFIRQSLPYLIGSGGTLMFDITIVSQSFCYRPRQHRRHHAATYARVPDEEEAGLLSGDALAAHPSADSAYISNRGRTSRTLANTA
ncbi:PQ loop repeat-domain-containing protein [Crepidotus variabilis]|uniref:PQ loop repeat-domain-containing protein n=1 Tax=Crepidotus variabilis TaxID=179855 RepID=A0A9P6ETR5_9AGAR|nr:PQ loop repeat-domain-containing protein [Crepidotus variabilis]